MAYDRMKAGAGPATFGPGGWAIDLSGGDYTVPDTVKAVYIAAAGNVVFRARNGTSDIPLTAWPAGAYLPSHVGIVRQTGTTATLATVEG